MRRKKKQRESVCVFVFVRKNMLTYDCERMRKIVMRHLLNNIAENNTIGMTQFKSIR